MWGLERNVYRLIGDQRILFVALDHPLYFGPMEGLENPLEMIRALLPSPINGFVLNPGIFRLLRPEEVRGKTLVIRANVFGSRFSSTPSGYYLMITPKAAINYGADAVLLMLALGGKEDEVLIARVGQAIESFHDFSIPVIVEVLPATSHSNPELLATAARIAAELGADVIKSPYVKDFAEIVQGCPVPVVMAGGPKDEDLMVVVKRALAEGARGLIVGRNVFQAANPVTLIHELYLVLKR